jgi:O-methyltransferase involved in polyketide biosynthesis
MRENVPDSGGNFAPSAMPGDSDRISPTAYYTAQTWVDLGFPHAELFATRRGRVFVAVYRLLERLGGGPRGVLTRTLHNRHATLDEAVLACDPDRVVELGAGLSPRGIALAAGRDLDCVDVDLPAMLACKRRLVERRAGPALRAALARRWRLAALDVTADDFADGLAALLVGAARPVVVAEGLVGYFEDPVKRRILAAVRRALGERDGALLADVRIRGGDARATRTLRLGIRLLTRSRGAPTGFADAAHALGLVRAAGFARVELLPRRDVGDPPVLSRVLLARP